MTLPADFPPGPYVGQNYTSPSGVTYVWDGYTWTVGFYDSSTQQLSTLGDLLDQIRSLLQDVDNISGEYRYSTDSIILCLNQGMIDLYRIRPDIFISLKFKIPAFSAGTLDVLIGIEEQYISPLIFYTVGLVQARDDEQTQDARAAAFMTTFKQSLVTPS